MYLESKGRIQLKCNLDDVTQMILDCRFSSLPTPIGPFNNRWIVFYDFVRVIHVVGSFISPTSLIANNKPSGGGVNRRERFGGVATLLVEIHAPTVVDTNRGSPLGSTRSQLQVTDIYTFHCTAAILTSQRRT